MAISFLTNAILVKLVESHSNKAYLRSLGAYASSMEHNVAGIQLVGGFSLRHDNSVGVNRFRES